MDKTLIGKRIRRQRETLNLTREQFAETVCLSPQFLAEIENGTKGMSAETLYKVCEKGVISADYILFGKVNENPISPIAEMLNEIPSQYSIFVEDAICAFRDAIHLSEKEKSSK